MPADVIKRFFWRVLKQIILGLFNQIRFSTRFAYDMLSLSFCFPNNMKRFSAFNDWFQSRHKPNSWILRELSWISKNVEGWLYSNKNGLCIGLDYFCLERWQEDGLWPHLFMSNRLSKIEGVVPESEKLSTRQFHPWCWCPCAVLDRLRLHRSFQTHETQFHFTSDKTGTACSKEADVIFD